MKKIIFSILIIFILVSLSSKLTTDITNDFIDDINTSLRGTIRIQKISNNKALDSNISALNRFLSDLEDDLMIMIDNATYFNLGAVQALYVRNFNVISFLLLILLLSSLVLPKLLKN